jgi:HK97 family phage major capsid protein
MNPTRGQTFVRTIKSLGVARGDPAGAMAYAQGQNWANERDVVASIKATVTPLGTDNYPLPTPAASDFAEFIRPLTIIGKLTGLRGVPARVRVIAATSGSTAYWSGERNPRPISRMTFAGDTLEPLSVIAMLVTTTELLRSSSPSAESILSRDLAFAAVQAMDQAFIDPANAGSAGVKPASITNGATTIHSSGNSLANIDSDLALLIEALADAGSDLTWATFILRPRTALYLSLLRGTGGALAHPGMSVKGGTLAGLPAIVSAASPSDVGSPQEGGEITLLDPSQIIVVDDGGSALEISRQTALAMSDSPTSPTTLVSMWQSEAAALKITRWANWQRCRAGMAQVLDQVTD